MARAVMMFGENTAHAAAEAANCIEKSPFFAPRTTLIPSDPSHPPSSDTESKSGIFGACANLLNVLVGSGIIGMPYAIRKSGMLAGVLLVLFVSFMTARGLRVLHVAGRRVGVPTYETLAEVVFGRRGFEFILANMFVISYGAMVSYLMIIRDTLPTLLGMSPEDAILRNIILVGSTLVIILPISMKRDMADLEATSLLSVTAALAVVLIIAIYAPVQDSIVNSGGIWDIFVKNMFCPDTIFLGLGVTSFLFVCQHSAFIVARSLERPTTQRWGTSANLALSLAAIVSIVCGVVGYLGFLDKTEGDILNSFLDDESSAGRSLAVNWARGMLAVTMFLTYPLESFVARHVCVTLLFKGQRAHQGDDHAILGRMDRRTTLTLALYVLALVPAILVDNLGSVLAISGSISASSLAYFGPGLVHLAVYGEDFLEMVEHLVGRPDNDSKPLWYYLFGFTLWTNIAKTGSQNVQAFRLAKGQSKNNPLSNVPTRNSKHIKDLCSKRMQEEQNSASTTFLSKNFSAVKRYDSLEENQKFHRLSHPPKGSLEAGACNASQMHKGVPSHQKNVIRERSEVTSEVEEEVEEELKQTAVDFLWSFFFMFFGCIALMAGLFSLMPKSDDSKMLVL